MRRILLFITDLEIGGTPTVVREVALRLHRLGGVHVEVACLKPRGPVAEQIEAVGVAVTAMGARHPLELPRTARRLVRLIRDARIDTVFSFLIHANTVAAVATWFCREVRFIQSIQTAQPHPRWHWRLQRFVHYAVERVVVPSPSVAAVAHAWSEIPHAKITVIPNAIDSAEFRITGFQPVPNAPGHGLETRETVRIGFIGRLDPVKRIPDLLHAVAALDDRYRLHIYGDGAERSHLQDLIDRLGITDRVTLHGAIARPQAALAQTDILVLPSHAEGFGLVLIEAMAAGVPVVATNVAGIRDVVKHEQTGLLVPVASPDLLASAIRRISADADLRTRLIANALEDVRKRFTWDVVFPHYLRLLCMMRKP